jgi:hypothetical protein
MPRISALTLLGVLLLAGCAEPPPFAMPGPGGNFAAFGEDEDICRKAGGAAIQPDAGSGESAARQYDAAYQRCMFEHGQDRQMRAFYGDPANSPQPRTNLHGLGYPDAFYSVPYGTPGYGYDGFSPR